MSQYRGSLTSTRERTDHALSCAFTSAFTPRGREQQLLSGASIGYPVYEAQEDYLRSLDQDSLSPIRGR
jgi:hypothetical protein